MRLLVSCYQPLYMKCVGPSIYVSVTQLLFVMVQFIFTVFKKMWLFGLSDVVVVSKLINIVFQFIFAASLPWEKMQHARCCDKCNAVVQSLRKSVFSLENLVSCISVKCYQSCVHYFDISRSNWTLICSNLLYSLCQTHCFSKFYIISWLRIYLR